jgi:hypothetical protein
MEYMRSERNAVGFVAEAQAATAKERELRAAAEQTSKLAWDEVNSLLIKVRRLEKTVVRRDEKVIAVRQSEADISVEAASKRDEEVKGLEADIRSLQSDLVEEQAEVARLAVRSEDLRCLRIGRARSANEKRLALLRGPRSVDDLENFPPLLLSPGSQRQRKHLMVRKRQQQRGQSFALFEHIGDQRDADTLAEALDQSGKVDALMETKQFYKRRIAQAKSLVNTVNVAWDKHFAARMKDDYLFSERGMDAMRVDWSFNLVNGKPLARPLLENPWAKGDRSQMAFFPEPVTHRTGAEGWAGVIKANTAHFGIVPNPDHPDAAERNFDEQLQLLVTRDQHLLLDPDTFGVEVDGAVRCLNFVVGLDGAGNFTHVCVRLVDYKDGVAKESELKGVGLATALGDDHNPNLDLIFKRLGSGINAYFSGEKTVQLFGRPVPARGATCLDYSASRSVAALRSNSSPHALKLHAHLIIEAPPEATMPEVATLILAKMPWRQPSITRPLNHCATKFPWGCSRCDYKVWLPVPSQPIQSHT